MPVQFEDFVEVGHYQDGQFVVDDLSWKRRKVVYLWAEHDDGKIIPLRVGIAAGKKGLWGRHSLHNRWLRGEFKPNDKREQEARRHTYDKLEGHVILLAKEVSNREIGLKIEKDFRDRHASNLHLDLNVQGSWIKTKMDEWRAMSKK